jgi:transposase
LRCESRLFPSSWSRAAAKTSADTIGGTRIAAATANERAAAWLLSEAHELPEVARSMTVPGLGPIRAADVVAAVVAPERLRTKQHFWSSCALGLVTRLFGEAAELV